MVICLDPDPTKRGRIAKGRERKKVPQKDKAGGGKSKDGKERKKERKKKERDEESQGLAVSVGSAQTGRVFDLLPPEVQDDQAVRYALPTERTPKAVL